MWSSYDINKEVAENLASFCVDRDTSSVGNMGNAPQKASFLVVVENCFIRKWCRNGKLPEVYEEVATEEIKNNWRSGKFKRIPKTISL